MKKGCTIAAVLLNVYGTIAAIFGYKYYNKLYKNNVKKEGYVLIPHGSSFEALVDSIQPYLKNKEHFVDVAKSENMDLYFHPGRYRLKKGKDNKELVEMFKMGYQSPNMFRIGDFQNMYNLIGKVTLKTELDSAAFASGLDKTAVNKGLQDAEDLKKYLFVDSYEFYWTVTPTEFFDKFESQYDRFWDNDRKELEKKSGLTRNQIYALASIVYKESGGKPDEMKRIAGLYLNRYHKGMKLQSDPTVIYAIYKETNFKTPIRRVLYKHLKVESPYNTYAVAGIPPGPICITDKNSVDAVLSPEKNDYIYMCADPDHLGYHRFTASSQEHMKNAKDYQRWLDKKNIK